MGIAVGIGVFMLACMLSSSKAQRAEARERLKTPGRIVGAITALVVVLIIWYEMSV